MAEIRIENLHKAFGEFVAVRDSTFTVGDGEFFVMLGPSGCGKTTTLRMIAGLELPTSGSIFLGDKEVTFERAAARDIAFVFQLFALYPHMNVRKNIGFSLKCQGVPPGEVRKRVEETARFLRIENLLDQPVSRLAGGDRQRVALGRAIVRRPMAFLMDEPLGTLDTEFRDLMVRELRALHDRVRATTVYVTHDQLEAMAMADMIAVMNHGVIEQMGTPQEIYDRPVSMFVADFIGSPPMNFLRFEGSLRRGAAAVTIDGATVAVPEVREDRAEGKLALGVRPEHIRFDDASGLRGTVFGAEYLGTTQIVTVNTGHGQVKARLPAGIEARPGENVGLSLRSERLSVFDDASGRALRTALSEGERPMAEVVLDRVTKRFGDRTAVAGVEMTVKDGEFFVLLGPTGAGKTTTLRLIAGLERCDEGRILVGGHDVTAMEPAARDVTMVFQQYSLYPHLSVFENLAFPLRSPARRVEETEIRRRIEEIAAMLRISGKLGNRATQLSGGEMQRVAIGRALVRRPSIYLMDEPLSSLDAKLRADLRLELKRIQQELGATILYVTHDQTEAMTMANRIGVIEQGRLIQIGAPREIYSDPRNVYVATRLGQPAINLFPANLIPSGSLPAAARTIGARTEHLRIARATNGNGIGKVEWVEHLGDQNHLHVSIGDHRIVTLVDPEVAPKKGESVAISLVDPLYFDAAGDRVTT